MKTQFTDGPWRMIETVWVYQKTEPRLYTVGYYDPKGEWHPESDFDNAEDAAKRVHYLNGSPKETDPPARVRWADAE